MPKRVHSDPKVVSCSVGGKVFVKSDDGTFDFPAEVMAHVSSHGFVDAPKATKAVELAPIVVVAEQPKPQLGRRGRKG